LALGQRPPDDEKQRIAFARVILQKPLWVVVHDALDVLDPEWRVRIRAVVAGELPDVGIINIGHDQPESGVYDRTLHLVTDPHGSTFRPDREHGINEPHNFAHEAVV
jgi:vitamin B12/bleomycin/antimicrobial peptide transport system ATP-binding/permease protein